MEKFQRLKDLQLCGITPYDATHLGHAATYLTFDLINRYLTASGSEVRYVQNITDIDDPLLERAKRDGVDWTDLAHQQIDLFRSDMINLRVIPPAHYIGAVDAIPLVTDAIEKLSSKDSIYSVERDLYFKVLADAQFGQRFTSDLLDLADDLEVSLVVTLGSLLADSPHTRPITVTGTASHPNIADRLGVSISKYEGPTGILGIIQDGCMRRGIDAISLWAAVPHYASNSPSPKAAPPHLVKVQDT